MPKSVKELAEELGLSTATVSRALGGDRHVLPATRARVLAAAGDERPRPRRRSAAARGGGTAMIVAAKLGNPITLGFIDGLREALAAAGVRAVITLTDYLSAAETDAVAYASRNGCEGIFLLNAIETPGLIAALKESPCSVVLINRYLKELETDVVMIDNYRCGYLAAEYLLSRHHRRVGHLAGPDTSVTCRDRTRGFADAVAAAGIGDPFIFYGDRTWEAGAACAAKILSLPAGERPTAVFSTTGLMAAGLVSSLRREGLRVPGDLSVIITDDYSKDYMPYPIDFTCYGRDPKLMGRTAAELFFSRVADPSLPPRRIVLPPVLTEYSSVLTP